MPGRSGAIALGGVFSALCLALMFMTGLFPFATFALPALAGAMLVAVVVEMGNKTALTVYVSVSLLSALIVADKEAAMIFVFFFGYYPILKGRLERMKSRTAELAAKFAIFNAAVIAAYLLLIHLFGAAELLDEMGELGKYGPPALLAMGNVAFWLYDVALTRYISFYVHHFRHRFLRR